MGASKNLERREFLHGATTLEHLNESPTSKVREPGRASCQIMCLISGGSLEKQVKDGRGGRRARGDDDDELDGIVFAVASVTLPPFISWR